MNFERIKSTFRSLRFRLMLLNALVVLAASMGTLVGLRTGMRFALVKELDQILSEDLEEIELAMKAAGDPRSSILHEELDRKARGHIQHQWFVRMIDVRAQNDPSVTANRDSLGSGNEKSLAPHILQNVNVPAELELAPSQVMLPKTNGGFRLLDRLVQHNGDEILLRVGASMSLIDRDLMLIDRIIAIAFGLGLVVAPLGGYWLAGKVTRPLSTMIHTADRLHPEKLNERLNTRGTGDELDHLSHTFNSLLDRIAKFIGQRRDFLANAAHELRTPLAALRSTAEVAMRSKRSSQEYEELLGTIVEESASLELLVNQLLLLAETEADVETLMLTAEPVRLDELLEKSCDMFAGVAENRNIALDCSQQVAVTVKGNRQHLRQVINNLIDNAIKFTPPGGSVRAELSVDDANRRACLSVTDTGIGIADTEKPLLFDRFYRGERSRRRDISARGTGLGLSICQSIIKGHGGSIYVESQIGVGSRFQVSLPLFGSATHR